MSAPKQPGRAEDVMTAILPLLTRHRLNAQIQSLQLVMEDIQRLVGRLKAELEALR